VRNMARAADNDGAQVNEEQKSIEGALHSIILEALNYEAKQIMK